MEINLEQSLERGAAGSPFPLVDRVLEYENGKYIQALKNVSSSEVYFLGHFPDEAIMPGVLIITALSQAARLLYLPQESVRLCKMQKFRFKKSVRPGDQLILHVSFLQKDDDRDVLKAEASVDEQIAASGRLLVIRERQAIQNEERCRVSGRLLRKV